MVRYMKPTETRKSLLQSTISIERLHRRSVNGHTLPGHLNKYGKRRLTTKFIATLIPDIRIARRLINCIEENNIAQINSKARSIARYALWIKGKDKRSATQYLQSIINKINETKHSQTQIFDPDRFGASKNISIKKDKKSATQKLQYKKISRQQQSEFKRKINEQALGIVTDIIKPLEAAINYLSQ